MGATTIPEIRKFLPKMNIIMRYDSFILYDGSIVVNNNESCHLKYTIVLMYICNLWLVSVQCEEKMYRDRHTFLGFEENLGQHYKMK